MTDTTLDFTSLIHEIGPTLRESSAHHDQEKNFVEDNYELLKSHGFFAAQIPQELGGVGMPHYQMCEVIETLAQYCSSTALAFSMHQHLLAALVWKYKQGDGGEALLRRIANQNLVLISTGAKDWLESNGEMKKTRGGYLVSGYKFFASQSVYGDVAITSARYHDAEKGPQVLHFGVPMVSDGVSLLDDWDTLGMRGTGSQTIVFKDVFVPDSSVTLERPQGEFHPFWNVVLSVAMPLIMSTYVGIARRAFDLTREYLSKQSPVGPHASYQIGELYNTITQAKVMHLDMVRLSNDPNLQPTDDLTVEILSRKTIVANACIEVVNQCMSTMGGKAYYKSSGLEVLFRDVQAARYHPLAEKDQQVFVGDHLLNKKGNA